MAGLARSRHSRLVALVAVVALAFAGSAFAAKAKNHKVNVTVTATGLVAANGVTTVVGTVTGKPFRGEGAIVYRVKAAPGGKLAAKVRAFSTLGSLSGTTLVTSTAGPNGSSTYTGTAKVTGGTGAYAHAKGSNLKVTGGIASATAPLVVKITGSVKY